MPSEELTNPQLTALVTALVQAQEDSSQIELTISLAFRALTQRVDVLEARIKSLETENNPV